jgi:glucan endo-1,3-alpha-glucosidase
VHFVPSFFVDPATFGSYAGVMDGAFNFNSGWPIELDVPKAQSVLAPAGLAAAVSGAPVPSGLTADAALAPFAGNTTTDDEYRAGLAKLPAGGGTYMAAASPWFFTHYGGALNKNFMYLGDNHLYASRWENLVATRDSVDIIELISWNDYGESHYLKDSTEFDAMPPNTDWVPGMSHQGWLDMTAYYAAAFKTGVYPTVQEDALYVWARPHARTATAAADALPPPTSFELTQDAAWAVVLATAPGVLTLTTGGTTQTYNVSAGANKLAQALSPGDTLRATLTRADATVLDLTPSFTFQGATDTYNYNAFVAYAKTNSSTPSS